VLCWGRRSVDVRWNGGKFFLYIFDSRACMCVFIYMRLVCVCVLIYNHESCCCHNISLYSTRFWRDGTSGTSLSPRENLKRSAEFSPQGRLKWHGSMTPKRGEKKRKGKEKERKKRGKKGGKGYSTTTFISSSPPHPSFSSLNLRAHLVVVCQYRWVWYCHSSVSLGTKAAVRMKNRAQDQDAGDSVV